MKTDMKQGTVNERMIYKLSSIINTKLTNIEEVKLVHRHVNFYHLHRITGNMQLP